MARAGAVTAAIAVIALLVVAACVDADSRSCPSSKECALLRRGDCQSNNRCGPCNSQYSFSSGRCRLDSTPTKSREDREVTLVARGNFTAADPRDVADALRLVKGVTGQSDYTLIAWSDVTIVFEFFFVDGDAKTASLAALKWALQSNTLNYPRIAAVSVRTDNGDIDLQRLSTNSPTGGNPAYASGGGGGGKDNKFVIAGSTIVGVVVVAGVAGFIAYKKRQGEEQSLLSGYEFVRSHDSLIRRTQSKEELTGVGEEIMNPLRAGLNDSMAESMDSLTPQQKSAADAERAKSTVTYVFQEKKGSILAGVNFKKRSGSEASDSVQGGDASISMYSQRADGRNSLENTAAFEDEVE
eukprot:Opistho-1_new@94074